MTETTLKLGLPKGRMKDGVFKLMAEAGIRIRSTERNYRPNISLDGVEAKILKPHNIVKMLHVGSRDVGFAGADWVAELGADLTELLDTNMDPVRLVAAAPADLLVEGRLPGRHLVVAAEYQNLTTKWIKDRGLDADFVLSHGATEVFPPEDADCIVDVTATGATLRSNDLDIVDTLMTSSTRLYAHPAAMENPFKRQRIDHLVMLLRSVLEARKRVVLEVNISPEGRDRLVAELPCMRQPTVSKLHADAGFAVKVAVERKLLPDLIPRIKKLGGTDIIVSPISQIVP